VPIVARHTLTGTGGEGIEIIAAGTPLENWPNAPLYVEYKKKTHEFRLHLMRVDGEWKIGRSQMKVAFRGQQIDNWQVRNHANGFKYIIGGFEVPNQVRKAALSIVEHRKCMIDFVALDILFHQPNGYAYVLEGNTAPGLEGASVDAYAQYLIGLEDHFRGR
jgi:hypothetical protein